MPERRRKRKTKRRIGGGEGVHSPLTGGKKLP